MSGNKSSIFIFALAGLSLLAALLVYSLARVHPPAILASIQATQSGLAAQTGLFGSAPSFFYTLALGLVVGLCAATRSSRRLHCLSWLGLVLVLESTQYPLIATVVVDRLPGLIPAWAWDVVGPYWLRGVFDVQDLLASLAGGLLALAALTLLSRKPADAYR